MLVEIINVAHRSGLKDGKKWDLSTVHVRTMQNEIVEIKVWLALDPKLKPGVHANIIFEGKYSFKTKQFYGQVSGFEVV